MFHERKYVILLIVLVLITGAVPAAEGIMPRLEAKPEQPAVSAIQDADLAKTQISSPSLHTAAK